MHCSHSRIVLSGLTAALVLTTASQGALIAYDPFNQAVGPLNGTGSTGAVWPDPTNNWYSTSLPNTATVASGSLAYGPLVTSGNQANLDDPRGSNRRAFSATFGGDGSDLWISFLIVATGNNTGISLFDGDGSEKNFMGASGGSTQTIGLQSPVIITTVTKGPVTHFYVLHLDMTPAGDGIHTLYIDPDFSSLGTGLAPTGGTTGTATTADFSWDRIRLGDFNGDTTQSRFDEFRMGNTWADVSPVPEPSTIGLLGLTAASIAARRRRRA